MTAFTAGDKLISRRCLPCSFLGLCLVGYNSEDAWSFYYLATKLSRSVRRCAGCARLFKMNHWPYEGKGKLKLVKVPCSILKQAADLCAYDYCPACEKAREVRWQREQVEELAFKRRCKEMKKGKK